MMTTALTLYDDRFAQSQLQRGPVTIFRMVYSWGRDDQIVAGKIECRFAGVSRDLVIVHGLGAGPMRRRYHDESRYPNQGWTCIGCPYLGIDAQYGDANCTHPFYLSLYGCPQSVARDELGAPPECPMLGARSVRARRIDRLKHVTRQIFWDYYEATRRDPYKQGFIPL